MLKPITKIGAKLVNPSVSFFVTNLSSSIIHEFELVGESITEMSYFAFIYVVYYNNCKEIKVR